jgi:hypothetical protein
VRLTVNGVPRGCVLLVGRGEFTLPRIDVSAGDGRLAPSDSAVDLLLARPSAIIEPLGRSRARAGSHVLAAGMRQPYYHASVPVTMPGKRRNPSHAPRGVQMWILAELREAGPTGSLSTAKLAKRIAKSSGKRYHPNSIYTALRMLTSEGAIKATRKGTEKSYAIAGWRQAPIIRSEVEPEVMTGADMPEIAVASASETSLDSIREAAGLPHKLALGEILVFPARDGHVLAATNLHGRLVFERFSVPD